MNGAATRADLVTGFAFLVLGLAVVTGSLLMDRLEIRNINPWTAPGVVPGFLGAVLALLGGALALRSLLRLLADGTRAASPAAAPSGSWGRLALALGLCLTFALGLVGRLPFWLATALFVFAFTALFEWNGGDGTRRRRDKLAAAAVLAITAGVAIHLLFQQVFLVRMP